MLNSIGNVFIIIRWGGSSFFVCVAADSIVACDGLAEEKHQHSKIHKGGKGIWEIGQKVRLEVMRRALC